MPVAASCGV